MDVNYCNDCKKSYKTRKTFLQHKRDIHFSYIIKTHYESNYECSHCAKKFNTKREIICHLKIAHTPINKDRVSRLICPLCKDPANPYRTYRKLRFHLSKEHDVSMNYEDICFTAEKAFEDWKEATEKESGAFYVRDSGRKLRKSENEAICEYFSCHRSYSSRVKTSERKQLVKSIGSNKFGFCCPSSMVVTRSSDNHFIKVKFCSTHVGHDHNIGRVPLSKNVKQEIAGKLVQGVTVQHIIDEIRDNCEDSINRKHFITKRDIWNIKKEFRISQL